MPILETLSEWLERPFLGNPLWRWAAALLAALGIGLVLALVRRGLVSRFRAAAEAAPAGLAALAAAVLARTHALFLLGAGLFGGSFLVEGPGGAPSRAFVLLLLFQSGLWGGALVSGLVLRWRQRKGQDPAAPSGVTALGFMARVAVWAVVLLLALDNLGVEVSALIAGLGVGGIAVALAVQNILGDLFASVSILLDRPFETGDFIIVGDLMGKVENIGLKTTRVRSLSGEQIVFSNADLLGSRIRNYKRMFERRVVFTLGVTYQTPPEKLEAASAALREIITAREGLRFDRAHFARYGDFALVFEAVYFVLSPEFNVYMDHQQAINLSIYRRFAELGIEFAYPTQTVFLAGAPPKGGIDPLPH